MGKCPSGMKPTKGGCVDEIQPNSRMARGGRTRPAPRGRMQRGGRSSRPHTHRHTHPHRGHNGGAGNLPPGGALGIQTCENDCPQGGCLCNGWTFSTSYQDGCAGGGGNCYCQGPSSRCGSHSCISENVQC